jgi:hypothetical protein
VLSDRLLVAFGALTVLLLGATQTYVKYSLPHTTATVTNRSTRPRYNLRPQHVGNEYCVTLAYRANARLAQATFGDSNG